MAEVHIPRSLAALFPGTPRRLAARGSTVAEVIADLDAQVPGIRNRIVDAGPEIRTHINVFVAGQRATLATAVPDGAAIHVVPAVSGGEERFVPTPAAEALPAAGDRTGATSATGAVATPRGIADPRALQILATEHWSLLSARSLVYNEAFARGGMFLALLSATLVALGLVSTATGFSDGFLVVAALVLGLDLFVGVATLGRVIAVSSEDIRYLQGMNRIRRAYFDMVPEVERHFITSGNDDFASVLATYGPPASSHVRSVGHGLTTMPGMLAVICCSIAGVLVAIALLLVARDAGLAAGGGVAAFFLLFGIATIFQIREVAGFERSWRAEFPASDSRREPPAA